jgi:hypothetical protein
MGEKLIIIIIIIIIIRVFFFMSTCWKFCGQPVLLLKVIALLILIIYRGRHASNLFISVGENSARPRKSSTSLDGNIPDQ